MRRELALFVAAIFAATVATSLNGATITVTSNGDTGAGTLRQAIADAVDGDSIVFNLSVGNETVTIASELAISGKGLTIDGANTAGSGTGVIVQVTTPGASSFRVFNIDAWGDAVAIQDLTIKGGDISGDSGNGGGILSGADLSLTRVTVAGANAYDGGGIYFSGTLNLDASTIGNNVAIGNGGGIYNNGTVNITSSTISGNTAGSFPPIIGKGYGGGIYQGQGSNSSTITSSTVSGNSSLLDGDDIYNRFGSLTIRNCILSEYYHNSASVTDNGYNVIRNSSGYSWTGTGDWNFVSGDTYQEYGTSNTGTLSLAAALADNGGPTQTLALESGSFAIDAIPLAAGSGGYNGSPATDQRGVTRAGPATSIGAYSIAAHTVTYDGNGSTDGAVPVDSNTYDLSATVTVLGNTGSLAKDSHTFADWNTAADGLGDSFNGGDTFAMGAADVTLYAQWTANPCRVEFVTDGTAGATLAGERVQTVAYGSDCTAVQAIAPDGYEFAAWSGGYTGTENPLTLTNVTSNLTVTANFQMDQVAVGSTFVMAAEDVSLTVFHAKPKVYATYVNPITGKGGKASAKVLDKVDKVAGNATLACEWTKKIRLYDAKAFKASEAGGIGAAGWITEVNQHDLVMDLRLASKEVPPPDRSVQPLALAVPVIDAIVNGEKDAKGNDTLVITGTWFGTKAPKVWREYTVPGKTEGSFIIKRQAMKVVKPTVDNTDYLDSKLKPACMDPASGESKIIVIVPVNPPKGNLNGTIVLENGIGLASGDTPGDL